MDRYKIEADEKWLIWAKQIPFLAFPSWIEVSPIPPFAGAMARLRLRDAKFPQETMSIYFDAYERLGCFDGPYWEIYSVNGDIERFELTDAKEIVAAAVKEFKRRRRAALRKKKLN